jgi:hypothetical protein
VEELSIEMKNVINKMPRERPKRFFSLYILLTANMTIAANYD